MDAGKVISISIIILSITALVLAIVSGVPRTEDIDQIKGEIELQRYEIITIDNIQYLRDTQQPYPTLVRHRELSK